MNTVLIRLDWLKAAKNLTDAQFREYINKIALYGFCEGERDVSSDDPIVDILLNTTKPQVYAYVEKYFNSF